MPDKLTKEQRHRNMVSIKSKDSKIELLLRKKLWEAGIRYRKNYSKLPGKPDIAITKYKIAVFCDSEFFHGKDWDSTLKPQLLRGSNADFWIHKISSNMKRDAEVNDELKRLGWVVVRFWGKDIIKDPDRCVEAVKSSIRRVCINGQDQQLP